MKRILIVDDDVGTRESLRLTFSRSYQTVMAENAAAALRLLAQQRVDLVLLDVMMPEKDGVTLLREIHELYPDLPCVMVSASVNVKPVVEAVKAGAYDFVIKPFDVDEIRRIVARALETSSLRRKVEILQDEVSREYPVKDLVGESPVFREALDTVRRAADSDATVLINGESGTGKELIARRLHTLGSRRDEPFIPVHCAALPESLLESELFGHEKGAFTGAESRKAGRFELAGSGTLFFDEVGEMSLAAQVKLLRVLQEREYMRVGGTQVVRTNARIIAATARNLSDEVQKHTFRDDLFYRLNVVPISLPPLRERPEDIPLLARYFLGLFQRSMPVSVRDFAPSVLDMMQAYAWPGNVRELRNTIERILVFHGHQALVEPEHLPEAIRLPAAASPPLRHPGKRSLAEAVAEFERDLVVDALRQAHGVQTRAAQRLGTTRRILNYRMRKLKIVPPSTR
jgi:DNA-binding NtrC family response regulator